MGTRMLQRRGTAAEWAAENPILGDGEPGIERDTGIVKFGDGVTPWVDLDPSNLVVMTSLANAAGAAALASAQAYSDAGLDAHEAAADPHAGYEKEINRAGSTTGQIPKLQGDGTLAFANEAGGNTFVGARVYRNAAWSVPNATATAIPWDSESYDSGTIHDNTTNPSRLVAPVTGKYSVKAGVRFGTAGAAGNFLSLKLYKGASQMSAIWYAGTTASISLPFDDDIHLIAGEYIELLAYQDTGSARALAPFLASDVFLAMAYQGA